MRRACTLTVGRGGGGRGAWQLEHAQCVPAERDLQAWLCGGERTGGGHAQCLPTGSEPEAQRRLGGGHAQCVPAEQGDGCARAEVGSEREVRRAVFCIKRAAWVRQGPRLR